VERVNRTMYRKTERRIFTALCLISLDTKTREVKFTNAGLNAPLIKSAGSATALEGRGSRFPLGSVEGAKYEETRRRLKPGEVVVFFTDGIPEARNQAKEHYGVEALRSLLTNLDTDSLSAVEIKRHIVEDVKRFAGSEPQFDDMTVVVAKVG
jgi:serine phosphatase RsbU (regulator of sigma subunit)